MKYIIMIIAILLFNNANVLAQEAPEPTQPDIQYEAEIGFGTFAGIVWQPQVITYQIIDGQPTGTHAYWSALGVQKFEATACTPNQKVVFQFEINELPEGLPFIFYRVRLRGFISNNKGVWSEASYWVGLVNINQPGRPIH